MNFSFFYIIYIEKQCKNLSFHPILLICEQYELFLHNKAIDVLVDLRDVKYTISRSE